MAVCFLCMISVYGVWKGGFEVWGSVFTSDESFLYGQADTRYYYGSESEAMGYGDVVK